MEKPKTENRLCGRQCRIMTHEVKHGLEKPKSGAFLRNWKHVRRRQEGQWTTRRSNTIVREFWLHEATTEEISVHREWETEIGAIEVQSQQSGCWVFSIEVPATRETLAGISVCRKQETEIRHFSGRGSTCTLYFPEHRNTGQRSSVQKLMECLDSRNHGSPSSVAIY